MLFPFEVFNSERQQGLSHPIKLVVKRSKSNIFCRFQYFSLLSLSTFVKSGSIVTLQSLTFWLQWTQDCVARYQYFWSGGLIVRISSLGLFLRSSCSPPPQVRSIHETSLPFTSHPAHAPCTTYAVSYSLQPRIPLQGVPRTPAHWVTMSIWLEWCRIWEVSCFDTCLAKSGSPDMTCLDMFRWLELSNRDWQWHALTCQSWQFD